ncbi:MAG: hypothetical protein ABIS47_08815 [Acidimicrobiales bacterium]
MSSIRDALAGQTSGANRILVVEGPTYDPAHRRLNHVLADVAEPASIDALHDALEGQIGDAAIMTPGRPSLVFLKDRECCAVVTCILPSFVRCPAAWDLDARLADPVRLTTWLHEHVGA